MTGDGKRGRRAIDGTRPRNNPKLPRNGADIGLRFSRKEQESKE